MTRTARAVAAAVSVAREHGLRVDEPKVLHDVYGVRVHLAPAPVVARISTLTAILRQPNEVWLARELDVAAYLARSGVPVVAPSALLPAGPHHVDGMTISFWTYVRVVPDVDYGSQPDLCGRMLGELHAALRGYSGELPYLAPPLSDIPVGIARIERLGLLKPSELEFLRSAWDELRPQLTAAAREVQPLHGDAHAGNMIATAAGPLWNDLEDVCVGPVGWDLSCADDGSGKVIAAYPEAPDAAELALFRQARLVHAVAWGNALAPETPQWQEAIDGLLPMLRAAKGS